MAHLFPFPTDFKLPLAIEAAKLVISAYDQYQQFKDGHPNNWHIPTGYDDLARLEAKPEGLLAHKEPFGFVARNQQSGNVFVSFRGTQSAEDWLSNFTFPQVPYPTAGGWGAVEEGFFGIYKQCSSAVIAATTGSAHVYATGHSLGGALATLAAADLAIAGRNVSMYNFASPRVGDPAFAAKFDATLPDSWRVVNTEDLVTTVPLATLVLEGVKANPLHMMLAIANHLGHKFDFQHVGVPVNFTENKGSVAGNHNMADTYEPALY